MKTITKIDKGLFKVIETEKPEAELMLDFAKVIDEFELNGDFYLIHWQARPKGFRQWGIYNSKTDTYTSTEVIPTCYGSWSTLQLNDKTATTIPSAVILFKGYLK